MKKTSLHNIMTIAILAGGISFSQPASAFDLSKFWNDLLNSIGWGQAGKGPPLSEPKGGKAPDGKPLPPSSGIDDSQLKLDKFKSNGRCNRYMYFPFGQPMPANPELNQRSLFLCRHGYAMQYDPQARSPIWVAFILNPEEVKRWPSYKRGYIGWEEEPHRDPEFPKAIQSTPAAMFAKGYLWVYLSPLEYANDLETDYQKSEAAVFNEEQQRITTVLPWVRGGQGMVEKMYAYLRSMTVKNGVLHVVDGPLYLGGRPLDIVGGEGSEQAVPSHMFFVVAIKDSFSSYGFIIPNNAQALNGHDISEFAVNIKEIEKLTNINFHSILQPYEEKKLEGSVTEWKKL